MAILPPAPTVTMPDRYTPAEFVGVWNVGVDAKDGRIDVEAIGFRQQHWAFLTRPAWADRRLVRGERFSEVDVDGKWHLYRAFVENMTLAHPTDGCPRIQTRLAAQPLHSL